MKLSQIDESPLTVLLKVPLELCVSQKIIFKSWLILEENYILAIIVLSLVIHGIALNISNFFHIDIFFAYTENIFDSISENVDFVTTST